MRERRAPQGRIWWVLLGLLSLSAAEAARLTITSVRVAPQQALQGEEVPLLRLDMRVNEQNVLVNWLKIEKIGDLSGALFDPRIAPDGTLLNPESGYVRLWFDYDGDFQFNPAVDLPLNCRQNLSPHTVLELRPQRPQPAPYRPDNNPINPGNPLSPRSDIIAYTVYGNFAGKNAGGFVAAPVDALIFDGFNANYTNEYDPYPAGSSDDEGGDGDMQDDGHDKFILPIFSSSLIYDWADDILDTISASVGFVNQEVLSLVGSRTLYLDAGIARSFFITVKIPDDAPVGRRVGVRLAGPGNLALTQRPQRPGSHDEGDDDDRDGLYDEDPVDREDNDGDGRMDEDPLNTDFFLDEVDPANFPMESDLVTVVGNRLEVQAVAVNQTHAAAGQSDVAMLRLDLRLQKGRTAVDSITLNDEGNLPDTNVSQVRLHFDLNGNGLYDTPDGDGDGRFDEDPIDGLDNDGDGQVDEDPPGLRGDPLLVRGQFSGGKVTFAGLNLRFSTWDDDGDGRIDEDLQDGVDNDGDGRLDEDPPGAVSLFVVYDIAGASAIGVGDRLRTRISQGDLQLTDPEDTTQPSSFVVRSRTLTLADRVAQVTGRGVLPSRGSQGEVNLPALQFLVSVPRKVDNGVVLTGVTLHKQGSSTDANGVPDILRLRVYHDVDASGTVTAADQEVTDPNQTYQFPPGPAGTTVLVPLRPIDNDDDGQVDEDPVNGLDDDGDGRTDEDVAEIALNPGESRLYLVALDINPVANTAVSVGVSLEQVDGVTGSSDFQFGNPTVVLHPDPVATQAFRIESGELVIADTLFVERPSPAPNYPLPSVPRGARGVPILPFTLRTGSTPQANASIEVRSLQVTHSGGGPAADVEQVLLVEGWSDRDGNSRFDEGEGEVLAQGVFSGGVATLSLQRVIRQGERPVWWVVYHFSQSALTGVQHGASLSVAGLQVADPDEVSTSNLPLASGLATLGDMLLVQGVSIAPANAVPGQGGVPVLLFQLQPRSGEIQVKGLRVHLLDGAGGAGAASDVSQTTLYLDSNQDGRIDSGDAVLGRAQLTVPAGGGSPFVDFRLNLRLQGRDQFTQLLLAANVSNNARRGDHLVWAVQALDPRDPNTLDENNSVEVAFPDHVQIDGLPLTSTPLLIGNGLRIQGEPVGAGRLFRGQEGAALERLTLTASPQDVVLRRLVVERLGDAPDAAVTRIRLFRDANGDGSYDGGVDRQQVGSDTTFASGQAVFDEVNLVVPAGQPVTLFVVVDVSLQAPNGSALGVQWSQASNFEVDDQAAVGREPFPLRSRENLIQDGFRVEAQPLSVPATVSQGQARQPMLRLRFSAITGSVILSSLRLDKVGGSDSDVAGVALLVDINNNGQFDPAVDNQIDQTRTFGENGFPGRVVFSGIQRAVNQDQPLNCFVTLDVRTTAQVGNPLQVRVADASYVTVLGGDVVQPFAAPIESPVATIVASRLDVDNVFLDPDGQPLTLAPPQVEQGQRDVIMDRWALRSSAGEILIQSVQVTLAGSAIPTDIDRVRLVRDVNGNGRLEAGIDQQVGVAQAFDAQRQAVFSSLNLRVQADQSTFLLPVIDVSEVANQNHEIRVQIASAAAIRLVGQAQVSLTSVPLQSGASTVRGNQVVVGGTPLLPSQVPVVASSRAQRVPVMQLSLSSLTGEVTVTRLLLRDVGSASAQQVVSRVRLFDDRDGDGQVDDGDPELTQGQAVRFVGQAAEEVAEIPCVVVVARGQSRSLLLTYDVRPDAPIGGGLQAQMRDGDISVAAPDTVAPFDRLTSQTGTPGHVLLVGLEDPVGRPEVAERSQTFPLATLVLTHGSAAADTGTGLTVSAVRLARVGTADDSDVAGLRLYLDEGDRRFDPATDTPVGAESTFAAGRATFTLSGNNVVPVGVTARYFVVVNLATGAQAGRTLGVRLENASFISVSAPDLVAADPFPLQSALVSTRGNTLVVRVDPGLRAPNQIPQGVRDVAVLRLVVSVLTGQVPLQGIRLGRVGVGGSDLDLSAIKLYRPRRDAQGNLYPVGLDSLGRIQADPTRIELLASGIFTSGTLNLSGLNLLVEAGRPEVIYVAVDMSPTATLGVEAGVRIEEPAFIQVAAPHTVAAADPETAASLFPMASAPLSLVRGNVLQISQIAGIVPAAQVYQGALGVRMVGLRLRADSGSLLVNTVQVEETGSAVAAQAVAAIRLFDWNDLNGDGVVDPNEPLTVVGTTTFAAGSETARFQQLNLEVTEEQPRQLLVVYDIAPNAPAGGTVGAQIRSAGVIVNSPDGVADAGAFSSPLVQLVAAPGVLNVNAFNVAPAAVVQGQRDVPFLLLELGATSSDVTVSSLRLEAIGNAVPDVAVGQVKLYQWQDDGDGMVETGELVAPPLGTGIFELGARQLTLALQETVPAGAVRRWVIALDISQRAPEGATLGVRITGPDAFQVSGSVQPFAGVLTSATPTIRRSSFRLTVSGVSQAPGFAAPGQSSVPLLRLGLSANAGTILVEGMTVEKVAAPGSSGVDDADIALVMLVRDVNRNGVFDPGQDVAVGAAVGPQAGAVRFGTAAGQSSLNLRVQADTPETLFLLADLAATAQVGSTLGMRLSSASAVQVAAPDLVETASFPLTSQFLTVRNAPAITVQNLAPNEASQGASRVPMLRLLFTMSAGRVELKGLTVRSIGTATDSDLAGASLALDNGDGLFDPQQDQVLADGVFVGGQAALSLNGSLVVSPSTPRSLFVLLSIADNAVVERQVGVQLPNAAAVQLANPDQSFVPAGVFPLASGLLRMTGNQVAVTLVNRLPAAVTPGQQGVLFGAIRLSTSIGSARLDLLRLQRTGSGADSDLQNVRLIRDDNADGLWQSAENTVLGLPQGVAGGVVVFSGLNASLAAAQPLSLLVVADLSERAAMGRSHALRVVSAEAVQLASPDRVAGDFPLTTAVTLVGGGLTVTGNNLAPAQLASGSSAVAFLRLVLTASGGPLALDQLRLSRLGSLEERFIRQARLYQDTNRNGRFDADADTLLGDPQVFAQGKAVFGGLNLPVTIAQPVGLLVVLDLTEQAAAGQTVGVALAAADDVVPVGAVAVTAAGFPIASQESVIAASQVTLTATDLAPTAAQRGDRGVPLLALAFQTAGGATRLQSLLFERLGRGLDNDVAVLRLYRDANDNGRFDASTDLQVGANVAFQHGQAAFAGLDLMLQQDEVLRLLVVAEIAPDAGLGNSIGVSLPSPSAVALDGGAQVVAVTFPIVSGEVGVFEVVRLQLPAGKGMVSVPTEPADPSAQGVFGQDAPLARWCPRQQIYVRPPDPFAAQMRLGAGYWTQLGSAVDRQVPGRKAPLDSDFTIPLLAGWNQIGEPFPFAVQWAQVRVKVGSQIVSLDQAQNNGWVRDFAWRFTGGGPYLLVHPSVTNADRVLEPGLGYFVFATVDAELLIPPRPAAGRQSEARSQRAGEWSLPLVVRVNGYEDRFNRLGISGRSVEVLNPPAVGDGFVDLCFRGPSREALAVDLRPSRGGRWSWEVEIVSDQVGETAELSWPDLSGLPREYDIYLVDGAGQRRSLRSLRPYTFVVGEGVHRVRIEVEPRRAPVLQIHDLKLAPTRGGDLDLSFRLSAEAQVEVALQTSSGRILRRAALGTRGAGAQRLGWVLQDEQGRRLPNGVYLLLVVATDAEGHRVQAVRPLSWLR